jgi:hypothetical protein
MESKSNLLVHKIQAVMFTRLVCSFHIFHTHIISSGGISFCNVHCSCDLNVLLPVGVCACTVDP